MFWRFAVFHCMHLFPVFYAEYLVDIEVNTTDLLTIDELRFILTNISHPVQVSEHINISDVNITTGRCQWNIKKYILSN